MCPLSKLQWKSSLNFQQGTFKQSQSSTWKYLWTKSFISRGYYFYYCCCCCCCQLPKTQRSITFRGHTYMTKIRTHLFTDTLHKPNFMVLASRETLATSRKNRNAKTPTPGSVLSPDDICHGSCWHGMCSVTFYILYTQSARQGREILSLDLAVPDTVSQAGTHTLHWCRSDLISDTQLTGSSLSSLKVIYLSPGCILQVSFGILSDLLSWIHPLQSIDQ